MNNRTQIFHIPISVGNAQVSLDLPESLKQDPASTIRGLALVAHPHPLMGGAMDNKVTQTLAKSLNMLGYVTIRPNFRGVGESSGTHDDGHGEMEDLFEILSWMRNPMSWMHLSSLSNQAWCNQVANLPFVLAGFSFGSYVSSHLCKALTERGDPPERLILVGSATSKWEMPQVPNDTVVIHGELDETIPIKSVFDWAVPQELPVTVIPGADHFFHRKLHIIRHIIQRAWLGSTYVE